MLLREAKCLCGSPANDFILQGSSQSLCVSNDVELDPPSELVASFLVDRDPYFICGCIGLAPGSQQ